MSNCRGTVSGSERAAVVLMALGKSVATQVMQNFSPAEAQQVGASMLKLRNLPQSRVDEIIEDFLAEADWYASLGVDPEHYVGELFDDAFGDERSKVFLDRFALPNGGKGIEALQWMDARSVAELVGGEHPQVIAVMLCCLDRSHGAAVLSHLPATKQADVVTRISRLGDVRRSALQMLDEVLDQQYSGSIAARSAKVGGLQLAAELLSHADRTVEGTIIDKIQVADTGLARRLQELQTGITYLLELNNRDFQALLKAVSLDALATALSGVNGPLPARILSNLSRRQADSLRTRLEGQETLPTLTVETAQQDILRVARRIVESSPGYSARKKQANN